MKYLLPVMLLACKGESTPEPTGPDCTVGFADRDGDGYGDPALQTSDCQEPIADNGDDCNDSFENAHPGAEEICDGIDNDCDGLVDAEDDAVDVPLQFVDADADGFGGGAPVNACELLPDHVEVGGDCDDADDQVNPGAPEICDGVDNNCDDEVDDEDLDDLDFTHIPEWYFDGDGDGYGGPVSTSACTQPAGTFATDDDCNDIDPHAFPGADERCNGMDDDCDGFDDFANTCPNFTGVFSGPFTMTMTDGAVYTCTGTLDLTVDLFATPPIQGSYTCTFDGTEGWDLDQAGELTGSFDVEGVATGEMSALDAQSYNWTGDLNGDPTGSALGLWVDGLNTWEVDAQWTLVFVP